MEEKNCLFCPTNMYLQGQILERLADDLVKALIKKTGLPWRIDKSKFAFVAFPRLKGNGNTGTEVYNPLERNDENVFITIAPEESKCWCDPETKVVSIDSEVYNLYSNYLIEG